MINCVTRPFVFIGETIENFNNNQREITKNAFVNDASVKESNSRGQVPHNAEIAQAQIGEQKCAFSLKALKNSLIIPGVILFVANAVEGVARVIIGFFSLMSLPMIILPIEHFCCNRGEKKDYSTTEKVGLYTVFNLEKALNKNIPNVFRGVFLCTPFLGHYLTRIFDIAVEKVNSSLLTLSSLSESQSVKRYPILRVERDMRQDVERFEREKAEILAKHLAEMRRK